MCITITIISINMMMFDKYGCIIWINSKSLQGPNTGSLFNPKRINLPIWSNGKFYIFIICEIKK